jgi:hypothetical protein
MIIIFSCITPIGILIGENMQGNELLTGIFFSISAGNFINEGSFLYIAATEVVVEEFSVGKHKYHKLFALLISCLFICIIKKFEPSHDDDGYDSH